METEFSHKLRRADLLQAASTGVWFVIASQPLLFVVSIMEEAVSRLLPFAQAWISGLLITALPGVIHNPTAQYTVFRYILLLAGLSVAGSLFSGLTNMYTSRRKIELDLAIECRLQEAYAALPMRLYEDKGLMDTYDRALRFAGSLSGFAYNDLRSIFGALVTFVAAIIAFWHFSPILTALIFILSLPAFWVELRLQQLREKMWQNNTAVLRKAYAYRGLFDPTNIRESRILGLVSYAISKYRQLMRQGRLSDANADVKIEKYRVASLVLEAIMNALVLIRAVRRIVSGQLPIGQFVFVQQVSSQYLSAISSVSWTIKDLDRIIFGLPEFWAITNFEHEPAGLVVTHPSGDIELKHVSFSYPKSDEPALRNVTLRIPAGQTVAIVGENGAGKTTLVKLLMKLYEPTSGSIMVGGRSLADIDSTDWRRHIGSLFQDFQTFHSFTIRDSVWFGDITMDREGPEVEEALRAAEAQHFVQALPHGLDTYIGKYIEDNNGTDLSGGQHQRLAIARTLFRSPDLLILDEPTSAIDANAEYSIFRSIETARKGRTTVLISHRFSTVRRADYIYVLDDGRLREEGTHERLMARQGRYYEMFTKQAEGYR